MLSPANSNATSFPETVADVSKHKDWKGLYDVLLESDIQDQSTAEGRRLLFVKLVLTSAENHDNVHINTSSYC